MRTSFGQCVVDTDRRVLERGGNPVRLSRKAFDLLSLLIEERPRAVSKQTLLERVWRRTAVGEQNVHDAIVEIRAALGPDQVAIHTVQRFGYAFTGDVISGDTRAQLVGADRSYPLLDGENLIGRDISCSIPITAAGVSRHHARIAIRDNDAMLEDLGSKSGTFCNERRISAPVVLRDGDTIRVGAAELTFRSTVPQTGTAAAG